MTKISGSFRRDGVKVLGNENDRLSPNTARGNGQKGLVTQYPYPPLHNKYCKTTFSEPSGYHLLARTIQPRQETRLNRSIDPGDRYDIHRGHRITH